MDIPLDANGHTAFRRIVPATVRRTLLLVLLVALVPVLLVQAVLHYNRFQEARAQELESNMEVARAIGGTFDAYVDHILSQELALGVALTSPEPHSNLQITRLLTESLRGYPSLRYYSWVGPDGRVMASSQSSVVGMDVGDRAYFRQIAQGKEWVVGDLMIGRVVGEPTFAVARGVRGTGSELLGVVLATVIPDQLGDVLGVQRSGRSDIAITDSQGVEVYRYPEASLSWEQRSSSSASPFVSRALSGEEVGAVGASPLDGRETMMALVPIRSIGWVASASHAVDEAMAPVFEDVVQDFGLLLAVAGFSLVTALLASRYLTTPISRLRDHAVAVGRGQKAVPVKVAGPVEVESLAGAFNRMAEEISLREAQREQLVRRQSDMLEMQEDLLRTISHDLRTPLTSIQGYAQYIEYSLEKSGYTGDARKSARTVVASAKQMNSMIQDLVDGARLESGQLQLNRTTVCLRDLLAELKESLAGAIEVDRIVVNIHDDVAGVFADPQRLERVMTNILTNALKYSKSPLPVLVSAKEHSGWVTVSIADQGTGIAPEDLPHLFDRYYRASGARKTEGLGIGLFVTRALVEAHGGKIWVESEQGNGTVFHFTLPSAGNDAALDAGEGSHSTQASAAGPATPR